MGHNMTAWESLNRLNIIVAVSLTTFAVFSLIQLGLMGQLIDFMEQYPTIPLSGSLIAMVILLLSGDTRSPDHYHELEIALVAFVVVLMFAATYVTAFSDFIAANSPFAGIVVFAVTMFGGAILGR